MRYLFGLLVVIVVGLSTSTVAVAETPSPVPSQTPTPTPTTITPTAVVSPAPSPTATRTIPSSGPGLIIRPTAPPPSTGIPMVDAVLAAVAGDSIDAVIARIHFTSQPCSVSQGTSGISCPEGQPVGTLVSGVWFGACARSFALAGSTSVEDAVRGFLSFRQSLWAVTQNDQSAAGRYEAFYSPPTVVLIDDKGITEFHSACGMTDVSAFVDATVDGTPRYIIGPGNPPFAPKTGTGVARAIHRAFPWRLEGMLVSTAVVVIAGIGLRRRSRKV